MFIESTLGYRASVPDPEPQAERPTAEPITAVLADRVRELRTRAGLSQAELAERMTEHGIPWKRATVVNLEKRGSESRKRGSMAGRDAVTLQEWLTLATVLKVTPAALLTDPVSGTPVPIAKGVELDPWTASMWLTGQETLTETPGPEELRSMAALTVIRRLRVAIANYERNRKAEYTDDDAGRRAKEDAERRGLQSIKGIIEEFRRAGISMPPLSDQVRAGVEGLLTAEVTEAEHYIQVVQERQTLREAETEQLPADDERTGRYSEDDADTSALRHLAEILGRLHWWGDLYCPPVPDAVIARADELGIALPLISLHDLARRAALDQ